MEKLEFIRQKYGKDLLIDAATVPELDPAGEVMYFSFYTICIIKKGKGTFHIDTESRILEENDIIFIKPSQTVRINDSKFLEGVLIFFEGDFLDMFFHDSFFIYKLSYFHDPEKPSFLNLNETEFCKVYKNGLEIHQEIRNLAPDSEHLIRALLYEMLVRLNRFYSKVYASYGNLIPNPHLLRFKKLMENRIRETHQVQDYADALGISRTYLNQICHDFLGRTSQKAIRERLLLEAKKEVVFTSKDISEIAYDLNFKAPSHFVRFFKQLTGKPPHQYRQAFSKG